MRAPPAGEGTNTSISSFRSIFSNFGRDSSRSSIFPSSKTHKRAPSSVAGTLTRGKVTRAVLEDVFGPSLLGAVQTAFRKEKKLSATMRSRRARRRNSIGGKRAAGAAGGGDVKEGDGNEDEDQKEKEEGEDDEEKDDDEDEDGLEDLFAGSDKLPGKLQVCVGIVVMMMAFVMMTMTTTMTMMMMMMTRMMTTMTGVV